MVGALILTACISAQTANALKPEIRAVSIFRNGYAVVLRDINLKPGDNMLHDMPRAMIGTLLFLPDKGVKVDEVVSTLREVKTVTNANSFEDLLAASIGKDVILDVKDLPHVAGILESASGSIVIVRREGRLVSVNKTAIYGVSVDGSVNFKKTWPSHVRALRFRSSTGGRLVMLSVEAGLNWAPSYAIDITDPKRLTITGKAIILNGLADLNSVDARLVTGFPNMGFSGQLDPLIMADAVGFGGGRGPGGGAGQGLVPEGIDHISYDPSDNTLVTKGFAGNRPGSFTPAEVGQAEDLFYYALPELTLKLQERSYRTVLEATAPYEHLYTWYVPNTVTADYRYAYTVDDVQPVWHNLKFTNGTDTAWTQASAIIVKNRDILAQSVLQYTSKKEDAILPLTKALDVRAEHLEEEVKRVRNDLKKGDVLYDLVTLKTTLRITNRKAEKVHIKVSKDLYGEVVTTEGNPKVTKTAAGLKEMNSAASIEWEKDIEPGKSLELSFTYWVYVRTQ